MRRWGRALHSTVTALAVVTLVAVDTPMARAQGRTMTAIDSALLRAQRLSSDGQGRVARALVDSVMAVAGEGSAEYTEALYWRATLSETAERARSDYLRLVVEFPRSPRAEDALLRLAQSEIARGDRAAAKRYLEQLALEHPNGASRGQGAYWLGRVLLDDGAMIAACAAFADAKAGVPTGDVELSNQIAYYSRPCATVQRAAVAARADSVARTDSASRADSLARAPVAPTPAVPRPDAGRAMRAPLGRPSWSAQVAAYSSREDADRLAKRLVSRGYEARVTPAKPFRVRIGHFATRAAAAALVQKLKGEKMSAIVVEGERP